MSHDGKFDIGPEDELLWDQVDNSEEFDEILEQDLKDIQAQGGVEALDRQISAIRAENAIAQSVVDAEISNLELLKDQFEGLKKEILDAKDEMDRLLEKKDVLSPLMMSRGLPRNWRMYSEEEYKKNNGFILEELDTMAEEFVKVVDLFHSRGCSGIEVEKVYRVQNPKLYRIFFCNLHQVRKKNLQRKDVKVQQYLFHGSAYNNLQKIADQGFDYRLCGVNGTAYGQGNYFAYLSSYSLSYSRTVGSNRMMFLAMVITGSFALGNSSLSVAPKDSQGVPFDSVVDNTRNPQIFVTFDNFKAYPAYVIVFK
jgi:hypothetical protein